MINTDYGFYVSNYGGSNVPEGSWNRLALKAEQRLESYTFGRMPEDCTGQPWENRAKCAVCEMVELLRKHEKRDGRVSENNDGYSVSYVARTDEDLNRSLYGIAKVYLADTGLLSLVVDNVC